MLAHASHGSAKLGFCVPSLTAALLISTTGDAANINEQQAEGYFLRAGQYETNKRHDLALVEINKALQIAPKNVHYMWLKAVVLASLEEDEEAVKIINRALGMEPNNVDCLSMRGQLYMVLRKNDEAIVDLKRAIKLSPKTFRAYELLGELYLKRRNWAEAEQYFDAAIKLYPNTIAIGNRLNIYTETKQWNKVLTDADTLLKYPNDGHHYQWHLAKARAYDQLHKEKDAHQEYIKVLSLNKYDRKLHQEARAFFARVGDKQGVEKEDGYLREFDKDIQPWR